MEQVKVRFRSFILAGMASLMFGFWLPAGGVALPPRPVPPTPSVPQQPAPEPAAPAGGTIELTVAPGSLVEWTVVQWQDGLGGWHDVDGWQGTLDDDTHKVWWVGAADLGKGPFRWLVELDDDVLAVSEPFDLPAAAGESVKRFVSIAP
ncbi:MAG: hypothetical protein ACE5E7_11495 [Anaerolineae bacterium]